MTNKTISRVASCALLVGSTLCGPSALAYPPLKDRVNLNSRPYQLYIEEYLKPGRHVLTFYVDKAAARTTNKGYSDVPFFGTFMGRGIDCSNGINYGALMSGSGKEFAATAGWGQVEGNGHPDASSSQCVAWVSQLMLNFDVSQLATIPVMQVESAVLSYHEQEAPGCMGLVYTQGGFAVDSMACWTEGDAYRENKPEGCLNLGLPEQNWISGPTSEGQLGTVDWGFQKLSPSSWDVTNLLRARDLPGLKTNAPTGFGYMLSGTIADIDGLTADDNTRCTSLVSEIQLQVTYTIPTRPPAQPSSPLH